MKSNCIIGKISTIGEASNKLMMKKIKEEHLPILLNHSALFHILPENGSPMLFNEIASTWDISKSSLSDIINKYENQGLLKKCICDEDKRSVYISLTSEAILIKKKIENMNLEVLDLLLKEFSAEQRLVFEENIDKVIKNIAKIKI